MHQRGRDDHPIGRAPTFSLPPRFDAVVRQVLDALAISDIAAR